MTERISSEDLERLRPLLFSVAYRMLGEVGDAEDVVQEAFLRAASRWPQVRTYQAPEAWVRKVALRLRLDAARRLRRQAAALTRLGARPDPQPALDPENQELVEALRRLPRRYREVLVLHHCLDRSVEDVGAHLGIPTATVKTRLARGRAMLAGLLEAPADQRQQGAPHARD